MKRYTLNLTLEQAELLDIALSIAAANAESKSPKYKALQREVERQFEAQD